MSLDLRIGEDDFARMFRIGEAHIPEPARDLIRRYDLICRAPDTVELEEYVLNFLMLEEDTRLARSKEENRLAFEHGWSENLDELKASGPDGYEMALKPKYYRGSKFFRYDNRLVVTDNPQLEYELFVIARLCLFHAYLGGSEVVYEMGCGTCANLLLLSGILPKAGLVGLDWTAASSKIAAELGRKLMRPISGHIFDMLSPDSTVEIPEGAAIISVHAFEQLGRNFEPALEFMVRAKPSIVLQYEPVLEFYDNDRLLDKLALRYCRKRAYLEGYYSRLREMEEDGKIRILAAYRPYLGGVLHESSVLVWKPL